MKKKISLGFSPCPNDTFMFHALLHGLVEHNFEFDVYLEDVETLNQWAAEGKLDITKLSYAAYPKCADDYQLLSSGSALGDGVGPLLICLPSFDLNKIEDAKIVIPGLNTTANFLFSRYYPKSKNKSVKIFSDIEASVLNGDVDAGVIIHENRFTYAERGLHKIADLGELWQQEMHVPIPLGGIAVRRNFSNEIKFDFNDALKRSIEFAFAHPDAGKDYVKAHSQEMSDDVIQKHIQLYVNNYSIGLREKGKQAIEKMFSSEVFSSNNKSVNDIFISQKSIFEP